ncbi:PAS domain-containing sensor histidine kinase [Calothrix rhizosoleniae]|uniref:PAS domain-containing sensor histidine kinase n=1 Tax=Calothrix rhizosoleniae TaxID=888997 RepID=UPI000B4A244B|nr:ATP-binding protein [Calothrix rhizosoleniae]
MIIDTAPIMIWMAGCDHFCHYFNQLWLQFTGQDIAQAQGNGWLLGVHPEDRDYCQKAYISARYSQEKFQRQYRLLSTDGEYHWILDTAAPRCNQDGNFAGYIGYCVDITEITSENKQLKTEIASLQEVRKKSPHQQLIKGKNLSEQHWQMLFANDKNKTDTRLSRPVWLESWQADRIQQPLMKFGQECEEKICNYQEETQCSPVEPLQKRTGLFLQEVQSKIPIKNEQNQTIASVIENIADFIALASLQGDLLLLNPVGRKLLGLANEEQIETKKLSDLLSPENVELFHKEILPVAIANGHWQGELYLQDFATGNEIPVAYHLFVIPNSATNEPINLAVIARDLTEKRNIEESLNQVDAQYRRLIKSSAERTKAILNILTAKATAELQRQHTEEALRKSETQFREAASKEALLNCLAGQIRASLDINEILETAVQEIRHLLKIDRCYFVWYRQNGAISHWEIVNEAKNPELNSLLGFVSSNQQIESISQKILNRDMIRIDDVQTMSDQLERELFLSLEFKAFLSLPIHTQSGEIGAFGCIHSTSSRHWQDSEVSLLLAAADQVAIAIHQAEIYKQSQIAAKLAQEKAKILEETLKELQAAQTQLIQSEKMCSLGQLVAGIAHEINNPINFIHGNINHASQVTQDLLGLVQIYQQYYPDPVPDIEAEIEAVDLEFIGDDLPKLLTSMKIGTDRIREIVLSLRNFSRLDQAEMKAVKIHEGIDSTLLLLQNRLKVQPERMEIQVIREYGDLPLVQCYAGQLNQVFMNLLANAIDSLEEFMENREQSSNLSLLMADKLQDFIPQIRIMTEVKDQLVWIRISDNGLGMTPEIQQRLFDPFYTTKPVGKGTGMGLSISYKIVVEKHGGQLQCISEPGKGAEFVVAIPLQQKNKVK